MAIGTAIGTVTEYRIFKNAFGLIFHKATAQHQNVFACFVGVPTKRSKCNADECSINIARVTNVYVLRKVLC